MWAWLGALIAIALGLFVVVAVPAAAVAEWRSSPKP
jgi:hypothetical protein